MKTLYIMRGCAGSGKSTKAKQLARELNAHIFSTDQYFHSGMNYNNPYVFDREKLSFYHKLNFYRAVEAMKRGDNLIIDNTNVTPSEAENYIQEALKYSYKVRVAETDTPWRFEPEILAQKNTHKVPLAVIQRMLERWVPHEQFIQHFKARYPMLDIA